MTCPVVSSSDISISSVAGELLIVDDDNYDDDFILMLDVGCDVVSGCDAVTLHTPHIATGQ